MEEFNTLEKSACLIVTDVHLSDKNIRGRVSYTQESQHGWDQINKTVDKYLAEDYKVSVFFLGDIFHNSYISLTEGTLANNSMISLKQKVDYIASVVGNHETTYFSDNPFWTLMTTINSNRMKTFQRKTWRASGVLDIIDVPDVVRVGNVDFYFNHYDTEIYRPERQDGIINVGLFHKDMYNKEMLEYTKNNWGLEPFKHNIIDIDGPEDPLSGYDYAYVGHAHMLYGEWIHENDSTGHSCNLHHLSSLGRTNEREVKDNFLERDIPAMIFHNNKFVRKEYNKFDLLPRSETVIEEIVERAREQYQFQKERKQVKDQRIYIGKSGDPVQDVMNNINPEDAIAKALFAEAVGNSNTEYHLSAIALAKALLGGNL